MLHLQIRNRCFGNIHFGTTNKLCHVFIGCLYFFVLNPKYRIIRQKQPTARYFFYSTPLIETVVKCWNLHKMVVRIRTWVSGPFLYLFSSRIGIFHKFLYRTFWYSRNYTYFYFPKWRYKPRMVLKITNLHILRYLPTCWLYLLERYAIDNQRCTHTASASNCLLSIS